MEDWAEIRRLHRAEGVPIKEIARRLGVARNTVRAALRSDGPPRYERARRGSVADAYEPQVRALLVQWPTDAGPGDRAADRLALLRGPAEEAAGPDPPRVRRGSTRSDRVVYEPGQIAQCDLWFPETPVPVTAGQARILPVLVVTLAFSRFLLGDDDPLAAGRGHPVRDVAADLPARAGAQDAGLGPGVRDRRHREADRPGGGVRRDAGHEDPAGPAAGPGVQGDGRAQQRVLRDLVPARPRRSPRRRTSTTSSATGSPRGRTPAPSEPSGGRPVDLLETDRQAMTLLPPVAPQVGLTHRIRLARDYYVRVDANDYSVDPRVIGRFVDVTASPTTVEAFCDGQLVARHDRSWARHMVITDPAHVATAHQMRLRTGRAAPRPAASPAERGPPSQRRPSRSRSAPCPTTTPCSASTSTPPPRPDARRPLRRRKRATHDPDDDQLTDGDSPDRPKGCPRCWPT